jgi:hypothetical protein
MRSIELEDATSLAFGAFWQLECSRLNEKRRTLRDLVDTDPPRGAMIEGATKEAS